MANELSTRTIARLRARDPQAWFELWRIFGPILERWLHRLGAGRIGPETVQDLSQETLAALSNSIDRHDPGRGARFSTWLLAIAHHVLGDEMDRRGALKRGAGRRPAPLEESAPDPHPERAPEAEYEAAVFGAKVTAAIQLVEQESDLIDFSVYRLRVFDGSSGRAAAAALGLSEATVSRKLAGVRERLRTRLAEVIGAYSFTGEEIEEAARNGLELNPNKMDGPAFDEALAEIYHRQMGRD